MFTIEFVYYMHKKLLIDKNLFKIIPNAHIFFNRIYNLLFNDEIINSTVEFFIYILLPY